MVERVKRKKANPALKHGGYSKRCVLPGEKLSDFEKLFAGLVDEFQPAGVAERDVVFTMARLFWRKQNLETFEVAQELSWRQNVFIEQEKQRRGLLVIRRERGLYESDKEFEARLQAEQDCKEAEQVGEERARKEFGKTYQLIGVSAKRTFRTLSIEERLDAMIDKCVKRLLTLRGVKSMIAEPTSRPANGPKLLGSRQSAA
jgi:hypothetical protein